MKRKQPGRKGFDLDYEIISKEYIDGEKLNNLASKYNVSIWTLLARFKKNGVRKTVKRVLDTKVFSIFTPESCYWAGFIAADGWVTKNKYQVGVELSLIDKDHLQKLRNFFKSNADICERSRTKLNKTFSYCSIKFNSVEIVEDLKKNFNIINKKSLCLIPPEIPEEMVSHYIRGYIDGDGCIRWHKNGNLPALHICSGSEEFLNWIYENILKNNKNIGNPNIAKRDSSNLFVVEFKNKNTICLLDWLYNGSDKQTRLDRKFKRYCDYKTKLLNIEKEINKQKEKQDLFVAKLVFLYNNGYCCKDIAKKINCSCGEVKYNLQKHNIILNRGKLSGQYGKKINERNKKIFELFQDGNSAKILGLEFSLSKDMIWHIIQGFKNDISK